MYVAYLALLAARLGVLFMAVVHGFALLFFGFNGLDLTYAVCAAMLALFGGGWASSQFRRHRAIALLAASAIVISFAVQVYGYYTEMQLSGSYFAWKSWGSSLFWVAVVAAFNTPKGQHLLSSDRPHDA